MRRRRTILAVLTAAAGLTLSGCGGSSSTNGDSPPTAGTQSAPTGLVQSAQFTVCTDVEFPPMEFFANGSGGDMVGFDVSAAKAVAKAWGVKAVLVNTAFDGLLPGLQSGKCDAVWSTMYVNEARKKVADAVPYLRTGNAVLVPVGNPQGIKILDDLAGKRVAVAGGTDTLTQLQEQNKTFAADSKPEMQLSVYPKFPEEVGAVASGKADAMVEVDVSVQYAAKQNPKQFQAVTTVFPVSDQLAVYVKKGSAIGPAIQKAYASFVASGGAAQAAQEFGLAASNLVKG